MLLDESEIYFKNGYMEVIYSDSEMKIGVYQQNIPNDIGDKDVQLKVKVLYDTATYNRVQKDNLPTNYNFLE